MLQARITLFMVVASVALQLILASSKRMALPPIPPQQCILGLTLRMTPVTFQVAMTVAAVNAHTLADWLGSPPEVSLHAIRFSDCVFL